MKRWWLLFLALGFVCAAPALAADVDLLALGATAPATAGCRSAVRLTFGDRQVVIHDEACEIPAAQELAVGVPAERLYLVRDLRPLADRLGYAVLYGRRGIYLALVTDLDGLRLEPDVRLQPVSQNRVVTVVPPAGKAEPDPVVESVLAELQTASYGEYLTELAGDLPTRYSCTNEVLSARDLIAGHFTELGLDTTTPTFNNFCFDCVNVGGFNVVGVKTGTVRPDEYVLIGAHYDDTSGDPCDTAPGANDNGSGAAAVLEVARVLAAHDTEASILFVTFGGEEFGMLGSRKFVQNLQAAGIASNLKGFVVMDMISFYQNTWGASLEGSNGNQAQIDALFEVGGLAGTYTDLSVDGTYDYWGSDHEPFLDAGLPGVLIIETDWDLDSAYHTVNDTLDRQDLDYGLEMTRLAAAAVATWAVVVPEPADDDTADDDTADDDTADDDSAGDDTAGDDDDDNDSGGCGC
ncbi:MAG: Zn-dependent exopeptidase M28 [Myxococcales bacterium]|nr:Zn-dependent exopeptidase M28 [Myxococcales bacterium]